MGTSNRSKKFHDVCWKNLSDAGLPDRILWIRAAAKKYPYMDTSRVGIYGGSAGGQNAAAAILTHGDFYKVAVADCGCHDNRMDKISERAVDGLARRTRISGELQRDFSLRLERPSCS